MKDRKILFVGPAPFWHARINKFLRNIKNFTLTILSDLEEAKKVSVDGSFDVIICAGTVQEYHDGVWWCYDLDDKGQQVILFCDDTFDGVLRISTDEFYYTRVIQLIAQKIRTKSNG